MPRKKPKQLSIPETQPKKRKKGGGRKKIHPHDTNHLQRPTLGKCPAHLTLRIKSFVPSLRTKKRFHFVQECLIFSQDLFGFRVIHFSVQTNHIHLLVEVDNNKQLERGMKSFSIRLAKKLNRELKRSGSIFAGRFDLRVLKSPIEVKRVLKYVLQNAAKHMKKQFYFDCFSSSHYFLHWKKLVGFEPRIPLYPQDWFFMGTIRKPHFWLARAGWMKGMT